MIQTVHRSSITFLFRQERFVDGLVHEILDILNDHLNPEKREALDKFAIDTIPKFRIERKNIVLKLFDYADLCEKVRNSRKLLSLMQKTREIFFL